MTISIVGSFRQLLDINYKDFSKAFGYLVEAWPKASSLQKIHMLTMFLKNFFYNGLCDDCAVQINSALSKVANKTIKEEIEKHLNRIIRIQTIVSKEFKLKDLVDYIETENIDVRIVNFAIEKNWLRVKILRQQCDRNLSKENLLIAKFVQVHYPHQSIWPDEWKTKRDQEFGNKMIRAGNNFTMYHYQGNKTRQEHVQYLLSCLGNKKESENSLLTKELIAYFINDEEVSSHVIKQLFQNNKS